MNNIYKHKFKGTTMKLLYVGKKQLILKHGWDHVNKRNQVVVEHLFNDVVYIPLDYNSISHYLNFGVTNKVIDHILSELKNGYDYVFVCQSLCGRICKIIKKNYPNVKIITFFHNIEKHYAHEYKKVSGIRAIPYYLRVFVWEKMAVKYSDYYITLNERDSDMLKKYYGCEADVIMPTSLKDNFSEYNSLSNEEPKINIDYLFVGSAFYANINGIQWFIDNVLPHVSGNLYIVGLNMSEDKFRNLSNRVHVLGFVENLSLFYNQAKIVISPIFHGGGMKTKTAEAMMYGKCIVGTKEAFEGYRLAPDCMFLANTKEDYISILNGLRESKQLFYPSSRTLFIKEYSYESSINKLKEIL